jgi:tetratricopeptide (TPR) repeat protein
VVYYVDDVIIGTDGAVQQLPFVAPGRRKLFVDSWNDCRRLAAQRPYYLPAVALTDFGISSREALAITQQNAMNLVARLVNGQSMPPEALQGLSRESVRLIQAIDVWNAGRRALEKGEATEALALFEKVSGDVPAGKIYNVYAVFALVSLHRWEEVDLRLGQISAAWQGDPRFGIVSAMVGLARDDLDAAEQWLREPAQKIPGEFHSEAIRQMWNGQITPAIVQSIRTQFPETWPELLAEPLVAEQYYFVLLWKVRYQEAERYASRMVDHFKRLGLDPSHWQERAGDAAFLSGNLQAGLRWYEASLEANGQRSSVYLKLSDVYFRLEDPERERIYREMIYGSLGEH